MTSDTRQSALLLEPTSSKSLSHARAAQEGVAISLPFLTRRRCGSYNGTRPPRRAPALHEHGAQPYKVGPRKRQIEVVVQSVRQERKVANSNGQQTVMEHKETALAAGRDTADFSVINERKGYRASRIGRRRALPLSQRHLGTRTARRDRYLAPDQVCCGGLFRCAVFAFGSSWFVG